MVDYGTWRKQASPLFNIGSLQHLSNAILAVKEVFLFLVFLILILIKFLGGGGGYFTKMCSTKFSLITVNASPKIACHKIQWLQLANRKIIRFQSWHSGKHFQIPITLAISTMEWQQLRLGKPNIRERGFPHSESSEEWSHKSIETQNNGCFDVSVITRPSDGKHGLGYNVRHLRNQPKTGVRCLWSWMGMKCIILLHVLPQFSETSHLFSILNTKRPISFIDWFIYLVKRCQKVIVKLWLFWIPFTLKCMCTLQTWNTEHCDWG